MNDKMKKLLQSDFLSFAGKCIRELDGTIVSKDAYLEYLAGKLTEFADRKFKRLLVNLPPRHLKSQLGTVCLAAWILGHRPNTKIMILACSASLAESLARSVRGIISDKWYREIFQTRIKKGHAEATHFGTTAGGQVYAASIHAKITGHGGDIVIVDDPHDISDASRPEQCASVIHDFNAIVTSRMNNRRTGRFLVIAHRIGENDLSAHLIAQNNWKHVVLPLIATRDETYETDYGLWHRRKGELLRPDAEDEDSIAQLKKVQVNPDFDMLYQQNCDGQAQPAIAAEQFRTFARGEYGHLNCVLSVDPGTTNDEGASFSVIQAWAIDSDNYYLIDQFRERCDYNDLNRGVRRLRRRNRPVAILIEKTANGAALLSDLKRKSKRHWSLVAITPRGSKSKRLNRHIDKIRTGRVHLCRDAEFYDEFVAEFESFPHGKHADQVDAFTQMADWADENHALVGGAKKASSLMPMVVGGNSLSFCSAEQKMPTAKPEDRGICAASGFSQYAPNGPFVITKAWVVK